MARPVRVPRGVRRAAPSGRRAPGGADRSRGRRLGAERAPDVDAVLSRFFGRDVELARAARDGYTIDQYHPDEENYDPEGHRDEVVEARLGAAFFTEHGLQSAVPDGSFFDLFPLSVLTLSTLEQLSELEPDSRFDARRFRMNVIVGTSEASMR